VAAVGRRFSHLPGRLGTTKVANVFKEAFFIIQSQTTCQQAAEEEEHGARTDTHTHSHQQIYTFAHM